MGYCHSRLYNSSNFLPLSFSKFIQWSAPPRLTKPWSRACNFSLTLVSYSMLQCSWESRVNLKPTVKIKWLTSFWNSVGMECGGELFDVRAVLKCFKWKCLPACACSWWFTAKLWIFYIMPLHLLSRNFYVTDLHPVTDESQFPLSFFPSLDCVFWPGPPRVTRLQQPPGTEDHPVYPAPSALWLPAPCGWRLGDP